MNNTAEKNVTWEMIDNQPIAHIHISADMTFEELRQLGRQIYATLAEMEWHQATLLGAGMHGRGHGKLHILRKTDYEQNHACAALCGKAVEWETVFILDRDPGQVGTCQACYEMRLLAVSMYPVEQESEGKHGSE